MSLIKVLILSASFEKKYGYLRAIAHNESKGWKHLIKYHQALSENTVAVLDTLQEISSPPDTGDRYYDLGKWLENSFKDGLLTRRELEGLKRDIGPNM